MADQNGKQAPDFGAGISASDIPASGLLQGQVGGEDVLLVRGASGVFATAAKCTHLGAPLAKGIVVGDTVRCPWHHACFDGRSGEATVAPAFRPLRTWTVERQGDTIFVRDAREATPVSPASGDGRAVIIGAGAGGYAAADALLRLGYPGQVTVIGSDPEAPYDRTLLSKDFLDGKVGDDKLPIEGEGLAERGVDLRVGTTVVAIEPEAKQVRLGDGTTLPYSALILATGSEPKRLTVSGADLPHVLTLRTAGDARAILARAAEAQRIVVAGSSFIGMEVAASLRTLGCVVAVVTPEEHPFSKAFGPDLSDAIMNVHRAHGTAFHLGRQIASIVPGSITLDDGDEIDADLVIVGIGVSPRTALAEAAGLAVDGGVLVDEYLRTSAPDVYAVGDIARWPDPHSGERIRVEHWDVATRQGQAAAATIAGRPSRYDAVPFFWTKHFDVSVRYLGHATEWDEARVEGDIGAKDAQVELMHGGRRLALATVDRDVASLVREVELEREQGGLAASLAV